MDPYDGRGLTVADSLYLPLGAGRFQATELTQGPWHPRQQHASPPAALLAYVMEQTDPRPDMEFTQFALDILGPIPVSDLEVRADLVRPGRRVQYLTAELIADGRPVARARAWRIRRADTSDIASAESTPSYPVPDNPSTEPPFVDFGYFHALDWRFVSGHILTPGPAAMWTRLKVPVVSDEKPSPLQRVAGVADTSSGISSALSFDTHIFTNVDFTLHFVRALSGEWVCLDAVTTIGPDGSGLCRTRLSDDRGDLGAVAQTLFISPRS
jgi:acyl-coenzyme A thioesterase PaaI-like protein